MEGGRLSDSSQRSGPRVTSRDVARRAGVSQSSVSRAFTPGASVAKQTRQAVIDAARELGYRPNAFARSLIKRQSRIIGLMISQLDNPFYPRVVEAISRRMQANGYHVLVFLTRGEDADDDLQEILQYPVAGLLMASATLSSRLAGECAAAGIPIVLLNRSVADAAVVSVTADNWRGGYDVAGFLLNAGHRRPAFIAGLTNASTSRDREAGFLHGLRERGVDCLTRAVGHYTFAGAESAALALFNVSTPPDAVFVANDHMAIAVMETLRSQLGLRIPDDVSVIGYDNVPQAAWASYRLTTVEQPADRMVETAVNALLAQVEGGRAIEKRIVIRGRLIVRSSARSSTPPDCASGES